MKQNKNKGLTIRFLPKTEERIRAYADSLNVPVSAIINMAVSQWLNQQDAIGSFQNKIQSDPEYVSKLVASFTQAGGNLADFGIYQTALDLQ